MTRLAIIILLAILWNACGRRAAGDEEPNVFRYNEASGITSLDPAFAKDQANIWPCNQLFNGLLQLDEQLHIKACIAKSWELDSAGIVYTFHLRDDVFFHDHPLFDGGKGRAVTAGDFVYSFSRILDPAIASPGAWVFARVDSLEGKPAFLATDDSTLRIILKEPFPPFAGILTMIYCSVVPHEIASRPGTDFRKNPSGTGPFRFKYWKEGVKLVLVRNDHYFEFENGVRLPYLDAVSITFLGSRQSTFLEFVKGNLDFISGLDPSYKDELLTREGKLREKYADRFNMVTEAYLNTEYLGFLVDTTLGITRGSPLRHKEIRQAINYGFDREKMIRFLRNNIGKPGTGGIIPPGLESFDGNFTAYTYQPEKARELIRKAGYASPSDVPALDLYTTAEYVDLFKYIQHQLGEIGLRINIAVTPAATLMEMKAHSRINFFRASWIADYPDEENYLSLFSGNNLAPGGPNYSRYRNPVYDEMLARSQGNIQEEDRLRLYRAMDRIIAEDAPVVVLYYDQVLRFSRKNVTGLGSNPMNMLTLKHVKKSSR